MRRPREPDFGYAGAELPSVYARIPKPVSTGVENAYMCGRAQTLRVDANIFENGEKKLRFPMNTDTCDKGFSYWLCPPYLLFLVTFSHAPCTL